jgi:hypothetical protein
MKDSYSLNLDNMRPGNASNHGRKYPKMDEMKRLQELVKAYEEYVEIFIAAEGMVSGYLFAHDWKYPDELVERGTLLRQKIEELKKPAKPGGNRHG